MLQINEILKVINLVKNKYMRNKLPDEQEKVQHNMLSELPNKYIIHEVHGEGGQTVNGEKLYWAKVRLPPSPLLDNK